MFVLDDLLIRSICVGLHRLVMFINIVAADGCDRIGFGAIYRSRNVTDIRPDHQAYAPADWMTARQQPAVPRFPPLGHRCTTVELSEFVCELLAVVETAPRQSARQFRPRIVVGYGSAVRRP